MIIYHLLAFIIGYILDLIIGDPYWLPHPIRLIGAAIGGIEKRWNRPECSDSSKCILGGCMVLLLVCAAMFISLGILFLAYAVHPILGILAESIMTFQILAVKCLKVESMKVYQALVSHHLDEARRAVSMIVGRETQQLDETGVAKAAIETVAENTSDGVIAPMLYLALGGPVLGFAYKTINTMDSMVGYKNEKYLFFGRAAAKLDDAVNFLPARISGLLMILGSFLFELFSRESIHSEAESECAGRDVRSGRAGQDDALESGHQLKLYSGARAWKIFRRDRRRHASPNSAHTEAVCAGCLGIQLAGDAVYFGKVCHKPTIGDDLRPAEAEDIKRVNRLMYLTAFLCELMCGAVMACCLWI